MGQSRTSKFYADNPEARKKRNDYQKKYNKKSGQSEYRSECNKGRRDLGLKKGDNRDASHTKGGTLIAEHRAKNRARNGANGKSTKK